MEAMAGSIFFVCAFYFLIFLCVFIASIVSYTICGAAIGAIPLMCGMLRKKKGLGWIGFAVCFALYWMNGLLLAQIASVVFTFLIVKDNKNESVE